MILKSKLTEFINKILLSPFMFILDFKGKTLERYSDRNGNIFIEILNTDTENLQISIIINPLSLETLENISKFVNKIVDILKTINAVKL